MPLKDLEKLIKSSESLAKMLKNILENQNLRNDEECGVNQFADASENRRQWFRYWKKIKPMLIDADFLISNPSSDLFIYKRKRLHVFYNACIERLARSKLDLKAKSPRVW